MKNIINIIAEALDDTDFAGESRADSAVRPSRMRSRPTRSRNHAYFDSAAYIEVALLDQTGSYSADGDLYDLTNDRELPESLNFLTPMLRNSDDFYGELILYFEAEMYKDEGDRDEYGRLMSPLESFDNRQITGAAIKIGDEETMIDDTYLDELYSVFEEDIQDAYVNTERD